MKTLQSYLNEALQAGDKLGYNSKIDSIVEGDAVYIRDAFGEECLIDRKELLELIDIAKENNLNKVVFNSDVDLAPVNEKDKEFDFGGLNYVFNKELKLNLVTHRTAVLSNGNFEVLGGMYYVRRGSANDAIFENMHITCNKLKTTQTLMPELKRSTWKCSEILMNVDLWQSTIDTTLCNCDICRIENENDAKLWAEKRNLLEYDTPLIKVNVGLSHTIDFTKRGNKINPPEIDSENMNMAKSWYKSRQYKQYLKSGKIY